MYVEIYSTLACSADFWMLVGDRRILLARLEPRRCLCLGNLKDGFRRKTHEPRGNLLDSRFTADGTAEQCLQRNTRFQRGPFQQARTADMVNGLMWAWRNGTRRSDGQLPKASIFGARWRQSRSPEPSHTSKSFSLAAAQRAAQKARPRERSDEQFGPMGSSHFQAFLLGLREKVSKKEAENNIRHFLVSTLLEVQTYPNIFAFAFVSPEAMFHRVERWVR